MTKKQSEKTETTYANGLLSGFLERQRLKQASQFVKAGDNVLDLACNEGGLLPFLPTDIQYTGIDIAEKAITRASEAYSQHTFRVADLTQPNLEMLGVAQFDVIVMLAFLEHIKSPGELVKNYVPYLKSTGMIVVTTPAPIGRQFHNWGAKIGLFSKNAAEEHETFLGRSELSSIATSAHVKLHLYRRFLFGFNQIACFTPAS